MSRPTAAERPPPSDRPEPCSGPPPADRRAPCSWLPPPASSPPVRSATRAAPTAPPAGPDSTVHDPCLAAVAALAVPPLDSITSGSGSPTAEARSVSRERYPRRSGDTAASTIVVTQRSYSRNTPAVSCEVDTCTSAPRPSSTSSATRCSCPGCLNPHRRQTAAASQSTPRKAALSVSSSSGRSTPSGPVRSGTATRNEAGTSGGGCPAHSRYSSGRACRPSSSRSVKPSVASSAVCATRPSSSAFVPTVMPCTKRSTSPASAPAADNASDTASITPSDWSAGVLGDFATTSRSPVSRAASVKVPPTSTPRITPGNLSPAALPQAAATTSNSSSRCLCDGQYLLPGSGTRWHAVPFRVLAWQQTGLPSNVTPSRSWLSTYSVASCMCFSHIRYT